MDYSVFWDGNGLAYPHWTGFRPKKILRLHRETPHDLERQIRDRGETSLQKRWAKGAAVARKDAALARPLVKARNVAVATDHGRERLEPNTMLEIGVKLDKIVFEARVRSSRQGGCQPRIGVVSGLLVLVDVR